MTSSWYRTKSNATTGLNGKGVQFYSHMLAHAILKIGITKSYDHPRPPTTSHDFDATTHEHPWPAMILLPPMSTCHNFAATNHNHSGPTIILPSSPTN